jgi:tripartite-type tricarboxylate transporter receptor subunit TctC
MKLLLSALAFSIISLVTPRLAEAQASDFPVRKNLTILVGFAAGGAADVAARIIARRATELTGQTVSVENKPGAGGNIATQLLVSGPTDGSVIMLGTVGPLAIAPHMGKLGYDPLKDIAPLTMGVAFPSILVVHPGTGLKTFREFIDFAKKHPGKLDFASTGPGSASHLAGELLNQVAGIDTVHVPYKGGAPALVDMLAGRVASWYATVTTSQQHIESGKLVPLAATGLNRHPALPQVPTIAESGYPGFNAINWYAFIAPARVPGAVLDRWNEALVSILKEPEVVAALAKQGFIPEPGSRAELGRFIASEFETWGRVIRERKLSIQ